MPVLPRLSRTSDQAERLLVTNRFNDLKNQLALAYEGDTESINRKLDTSRDISEIFRRAQQAFNAWAKLPAVQRTSEAILKSLDFDFFKLLDSVTIARSRRHIQTFYDTAEVGTFPTRLPPQSYRCPLTHRGDVPNLNEIYNSLASLTLAVYAPVAYIPPAGWRSTPNNTTLIRQQEINFARSTENAVCKI